jgi:hypothetical protein
MTNPAAGVYKQVAFKRNTGAYGALPSNAGGQLLRRTQSTLNLTKDIYKSNEINTHMQDQDVRHGVRRVSGSIQGELSAGTYSDFFAAALRRDFTAGEVDAGLNLTIAAGAGSTYTITRDAGSFITDGFKKGDVVRLTAGAFNAANLNKNLVVVNLTALVATVMVLNGSTLTAEGPIAAATLAVAGKKTFMPSSGQTAIDYAIEHWYADVGISHVFTGCMPTQITLNLPPTGMATIETQFVGQNLGQKGSAQYFDAAAAATTTGIMAAVNGMLVAGGTRVATVTGAQATINGNRSGDPVVGSNVLPFSFAGRLQASGQLTVYLADSTFYDAFDNETELDLYLALTADDTANSDFLSLVLPRLKLSGASMNDGEGGIVMTCPFTALYNSAGGTGTTAEQTTLVVQDSAA